MLSKKELIEKIYEEREKFPPNYGFKGRWFYNDDFIIKNIKDHKMSIKDALKDASDWDYSERFENAL